MIRTSLLGIGCLIGFAGAANAQYYGPGFPGGFGTGFGGSSGFGAPGYGFGPNVMPNIYNPRNQPLSPYLNMLRGGNAGVNYYYGVRPGTTGGAGGFGPGPFMGAGGARPPYFPVNYDDPGAVTLTDPDKDKGYILPPAGHPVVYGNTLGYFPGGPGYRGAGLSRPGIGGTSGGANRSTATPRR